MSVRTTIDIPDELYAALRLRAAEERTSIRALVTDAIGGKLQQRRSLPVTGPLVGKRAVGKRVPGRKVAGKKGRPAPGSPDTENPYDVLFA